jgi:osmoprotectant transport system permease protein
LEVDVKVNAVSSINRIAVLGGVMSLSSLLALSFLVLKPNRLAPGRGVGALSLGFEFWVLPALALIVLAVAFVSSSRVRAVALVALGNAFLIAQTVLIGVGASRLLVGAGEVARVSVASAGWLGLLSGVIVLFAASRDLAQTRVLPPFTVFLGAIVTVGIAVFGGLNDLSVMREYTANAQGFQTRVLEHVFLAGAALVLSGLLGSPLGVWAARDVRVSHVVLGISSALQTIPSIALLTMLIAPFSGLARSFPFLETIGVRGIGPAPALTALTLYGLLPIVRGTVNGLRSVNPATLEAARGMGMTDTQRFWRVEWPLALPLIMSGFRTGAVSLVGLAALSSLVGAGGLGIFIFAGLGGAALDQVLLGAIPVLALAVLTDTLFGLLERSSLPRGLRPSPPETT